MLVKVTLGQRSYVNGAYRDAGESVMVDETLAEALAYKPKKSVLEKAERLEEKEAREEAKADRELKKADK
jgi:hypothetical protein